MTSRRREIVLLILQFLDEEKFKGTVHMLEQESGFFFNIRYFEELVINGDWDKVENYLSGFMKVGDNNYSTQIFFEIRKQKYLEALDRKDRDKAVDILKKELNVFSVFNQNIFKEMTQLLTLEDFRENEQLSQYGDIKNHRRKLFDALKLWFQGNPLIRDKLNFPNLNSKLQTLIDQSFNWQHPLQLVDPSRSQLQPIGAQAHGGFSPLGARGKDINQSSAYDQFRIADESVDDSRIWKLTEVSEPSQCRSLRLPDNLKTMRVSRLMYTKSGVSILALAANAVHKLWKWPRNDENLTGKATSSVVPQLWQPSRGILMTNDISNPNPEDVVPCLALSTNGSYVMSASGGKISLYSLKTFETMTTFMPPPPAATSIAFCPQDNNIIAVGMEDSSIQIYYIRLDEVKHVLKSHRERITGLAFSNALNVLVSSGADSWLHVWSTDGWKRRRSKCLLIPVICIQFHQDQTRLLAVHASQIAIYEAPKLELLNQWIPPKASALITYATYSCDSQSIYVGFDDGDVCILTASASLQLRCTINSTSYLPANPSSGVHPLVIAAHPSETNQFALGLSDGGVCILEPLESEGKWGTPPPHEDVAG